MRVISQNQKYDVPYEQTAWNGAQWLFAEYSTSERVQKAMEMLRGWNLALFALPKDELIERVYDEAKSYWEFQ